MFGDYLGIVLVGAVVASAIAYVLVLKFTYVKVPLGVALIAYRNNDSRDAGASRKTGDTLELRHKMAAENNGRGWP